MEKDIDWQDGKGYRLVVWKGIQIARDGKGYRLVGCKVIQTYIGRMEFIYKYFDRNLDYQDCDSLNIYCLSWKRGIDRIEYNNEEGRTELKIELWMVVEYHDRDG